MSEVTIEQMNEVIGRFMGYKMYDKRYPRNHGVGAPEAIPEKCMIIQKAKYHSSWDVLMSVWSRLKDAVLELEESDGDYPADFCAMSDVWENACFEVNLVNAHYLVHDAIKWYNQQKQNNEEKAP